ncbi:MAG: hypothetical protein IJK89_05205 [Clostridia bacterium]|nr:hypothetical protein [Clostridia bacterium]
MKKWLPGLLAVVILLSSCASNNAVTATDAVFSDDTAANGSPVTVPNVDLTDKKAEIDMTGMTKQMAYVQLSNMMLRPEDYIGKTVKLRGVFAHAAENDREFFVCYIMDETACCSQSLEFKTDNSYPYPEAYPPERTEITVYGVFDTYQYNGYEMYRLLHAELSY